MEYAPSSGHRSVCEIDEQCETEAVSGQGTGQCTAPARVKMYSRGEEAESVDCGLTQPLSPETGKGPLLNNAFCSRDET